MKTPARTFYGFIHEGKIVLSAKASFAEYVRKSFKDRDDVEIEIQPLRRRRTLQQNRWFHSAITPWAEEEGIEIDDLKRDLMGTIFGWSEKVSPLSEQRIPLKAHTSDLTVEEFSVLMERTVQLAAECHVVVLLPDEYRAQRAKRGRRAA